MYSVSLHYTLLYHAYSTNLTQIVTLGQGVGIESATSFCIIFPSQPGNGVNTNYIAETEKSAVSGCTSQVPVGAKPAKSLPSGFIKSAHMISNEYYSQVTGTYDPSKYGLNPNDDGTQYDDSLASQGGVLPDSGCAGFQGYLEYFGGGTFCIRCCNYAFSYYCNPSLDTRGCRVGTLFSIYIYLLTLLNLGIPGDYDTPGFTNNGAPAVTGSASSSYGSAPNPRPDYVPDWSQCAAASDTCMSSGFTCCQAPADAQAGNGKTTCRAPGYCANPQGPNPYAGAKPGPGPSTGGGGSTPPPPSSSKNAWEDCTPGVSVCPSGYMCCVAPAAADVSANKNTCRLAGLAANDPNGCHVASSTTTSTTRATTSTTTATSGSFTTDPAGQKCGSANNNWVCPSTTASCCSQYGTSSLSLFLHYPTCLISFHPTKTGWCGSTAAYCGAGNQASFNYPGSSPSPPPSPAPGTGKPQPDWENCKASVDTCLSPGFTCCVAPADVGSGKTTCRASGYCASGIAPSGPLVKPDWQDCRIGTDTCASASFTCCVAPADVVSGKSTCRAPGTCA